MPSYYHLPWFVKIAAKITLSWVPLPYNAWRSLRMFRHGGMADVEYAYGVFHRHFEQFWIGERAVPFRMLELGPGDSILSAIFAYAHSAQRSVLVDVADCAERRPEVYFRASEMLRQQGLPVPDFDGSEDFAAICKKCRADYLTDGLASLRSLPSESIDFIWSQAVLEHIRRNEFIEVLAEMHRILKPDGVASHRIDLRDHLGGKLNNLRFSHQRWESPTFASSGFYTNRIRFGEMLRLFRDAGFATTVTRVSRWSTLPTPRRGMDDAFRSIPEEDLCVQGFDVVLRRHRAAHHAA